ncbi:DUF6264 family protein [Curtobacterium ammoniigenes]|uniref:DUF6264 family protein n=1 Tax=Curtobacterium ammoniigenes TaxID=395387 RepID=UPI001FDF223D|nr:DUF6264 family protein [Curtobacterium ammoniigenes]
MSADGRPVGRPAPQYGEYAPEGWVSPFLADEAPSLPQASADRSQLDSAGGARPRPRGWNASDETSGSKAGLPSSDGRGSRGAVGRRSSRADVLLTAVLLGIGLTSVIQQLADVSGAAASVAQTLAAQYVALAHPEALVVAAAWCGVGQAAVYVVALWWSIRRIRARRRAMWIPLAGGALVTIASGIVYFAVALHDPAFAAWFASHSPS